MKLSLKGSNVVSGIVGLLCLAYGVYDAVNHFWAMAVLMAGFAALNLYTWYRSARRA